MRFLLIILLFSSCTPTQVPPQSLDSTLFEQDRTNKELELELLNEIKIAEQNQDHEAYEFFLREYIQVPRLDLNDSYKKDPRYFEGGINIKY